MMVRQYYKRHVPNMSCQEHRARTTGPKKKSCEAAVTAENVMKNLHAFLVSSKFQIVFKPQDTDGSGNGGTKMQFEMDSS
jgi:hypothetical protein